MVVSMKRSVGQATLARCIENGRERDRAHGRKTQKITSRFQTGLMDKNWKRFERRVAERCGGHRVSVADRLTDLDVHHPLLGIECKYRENLSQYLKDWYQQAKEGSKLNQIPVVAIGEKRSSRILALLDFDDLVKLSHALVVEPKEPDNYGGTD
jgi:hypothetical protein